MLISSSIIEKYNPYYYYSIIHFLDEFLARLLGREIGSGIAGLSTLWFEIFVKDSISL
jgi:hypothetical protein